MTHDSTTTVWVGMDVHQESITAAILFGDKDIPEIVRLPGDLNAVRRLFRRLTKRVPRGRATRPREPDMFCSGLWTTTGSNAR